jgi:hypothetical protein
MCGRSERGEGSSWSRQSGPMPGQPVRQRPEAVMVPDTLLCVVVPVRDLRDPHDELDVHVGLVQLAADRTTLSWKCPSSAACPAARGGCHRLPVGSLMLLSPPKVCREVGLGCSVKTTTRQGTAVRKTCRTRRSGRASRPCRTRWAWRCPAEAAAVVHSSLGPRPVPVVPMPSSTISASSRHSTSTDPADQLVSVSHGGPDGYARSIRAS